MFKLRRYLKPYLKELTIGPFFKWLEAIFELIVPLVVARIIDVGVRNRDVGYTMRMGGVMVLLGVVGLGCALICQYYAAKASQGFGTDLRNDLFLKVNTLSQAELERFGGSSLLTRIIGDINQLQLAVAMLIRLAVRAPFILLGSAAMGMLLDVKLSLVFLVAAPLIVLILCVVMRRSVPFYKTVQKKLDRITLIARENLSGVRVIRAFGRQKDEQARFRTASDELAETAIRVGKLSALLNPLTYAVLYFAVIAVLWFGGMRVQIGDLTQGEIITFVSYMTQISLTLVVFANLIVIFTRASASAVRVNEVFCTEPSVQTLGNEQPADGSVRFQNVSFSYHGKGGEPALSDLTFSVESGAFVGVIGGTGSGKSTLVQLIARFYDVTAGELLVGGQPVSKLAPEALRRTVALVPQRTALFSGSVRDNMQWGNEQASDAQIVDALKTAQAYEFVSRLPGGLDAPLLQGGRNLSGGQRQRLTIARALVAQPKILILDDSTSALDFATDAALRKAIARDTAGATVFCVSQRAASVMHADRILVLDDGRAVGFGTHAELLQDCAVYREICHSQFSESEVVGG